MAEFNSIGTSHFVPNWPGNG